MSPEVVIDRDANQPEVPVKGQGDGKETVTISRAELESLNRRLAESEQSERAWAQFHRNSAAAPAAEPVQERDDDINVEEFVDADETPLAGDSPEKLVDEIAAQGTAAIAKRGFITAAEAQRIAADVAARVGRELIGRERQKITSDSQIMTEFPELKDPNSELFKMTAGHYQRAVAMDPNAKKTPAALYLAARAARIELDAKKGNGRNGNRGNEREDFDDREQDDDRQARIDAQDGRTRTPRQQSDVDDMLGDEARQVIKGMGISDSEFQASRKEIRGGRPRVRR